jgi:hypothetical protein
MARLRIAFALVGVVLAAAASAMPLYFDRFKQLYQVPAGSVLERAQCKTCHSLETGPPSLNVFGARLQLLINRSAEGTPQGGVTQDTLIYVENQDTDGDGYTNLEEIIVGTLPGEALSHPKVHPTNLPKHHISKKWNQLLLEVTGGLLLLGVILVVGGKSKKNGLGKLGVGLWMLGVLAAIGTVVMYVLSDRHP